MCSVRLSLISLLAAYVLTIAPQAAAEQIADFESGPWVGGAYADTDGTFVYCAAAIDGPRRAMFLVVKLRNLKWAVALANPAWRLDRLKTYPARFRVDLGSWWETTVKGAQSDEVMVPVQADSPFFERLR